MNAFELMIVRKALVPSVREDVPGLMRLHYASFRLLPTEAARFIGQFEPLMRMKPGITDAPIDLASGTLTVRYDPSALDSRGARAWLDTVTAEIVGYLKDISAFPDDPEEVGRELASRLAPKL